MKKLKVRELLTKARSLGVSEEEVPSDTERKDPIIKAIRSKEKVFSTTSGNSAHKDKNIEYNEK